jgi:hypothetical protein
MAATSPTTAQQAQPDRPRFTRAVFKRVRRRSSRLVPHITLSPRPPCDKLFFFDGHLPGNNNPEPDEEQSDDNEDEEFTLEFYDNASSYPSVNYEAPIPETRHANNSIVSDSTENAELKALLEFCPFSLTFSGKKCPLGEDCTLKKICHRNSNPRGCSRGEGCEYSHEHVRATYITCSFCEISSYIDYADIVLFGVPTYRC